jgi:hypothetical protein
LENLVSVVFPAVTGREHAISGKGKPDAKLALQVFDVHIQA